MYLQYLINIVLQHISTFASKTRLNNSTATHLLKFVTSFLAYGSPLNSAKYVILVSRTNESMQT